MPIDFVIPCTAARVEAGSAGAGEATAHQYLDQVGGLREVSVAVDRGDDSVTATVEARAVSLVGFLDPPIAVTITAPVERVVG